MTKGSKALLEYLLEMLTTMAKDQQLLNLAHATLYDLVLNSFIKIDKALDQFINPQQKNSILWFDISITIIDIFIHI